VIRSLLIANRAEIARRIQRTAAAMGIRCVAVFAPPDRDAPFVREADEAVALPGGYLDIEAVIGAAVRSGADAVHPGYGFLSERADFARAVLAAGLTWVGPPPDVIANLGDKIQAKKMMAAAGVPALPTWQPEDPGVTFPVLVKASAGGGGKGMRVVAVPGDLPDAIAAARREAEAAFGDPTIFLERYVTLARHVEIQILADQQEHVIHCFERECSIQRRHQKVIEECPSPALDPELREHMGAAAIAAARSVGYLGAGTVEFVLEPDGRFWFLEVNTRLQVEHPVTEAVTGLDLVREQLRVAQGLPLSVEQDDLRMEGHAIEARLYAEDPASGFLPSTGRLIDWSPAETPVARWDSGVETGTMVGTEFDPMLAKVIVHAPAREEAAARLALALERSRIRGVKTNRDFLVNVVRHPSFLAGDTTTDFIERTGVERESVPTEQEIRIASIGAALALRHHNRQAARVLRSIAPGWRNSVMPPEAVVLGGRAVTYRTARSGRLDFEIEGWKARVDESAVDGNWLSFEMEGDSHRIHVLADGTRVWSGSIELDLEPRFPESTTEVIEGGLVAPMPGKVISVEVAAGDEVEAGQVLLIVEAMKMEHRIVAPRAGTVTDVRARPGDQVSGGDLLAVLE
jgi:propionyl-CoA carboxylase alpha chain